MKYNIYKITSQRVRDNYHDISSRGKVRDEDRQAILNDLERFHLSRRLTTAQLELLHRI